MTRSTVVFILNLCTIFVRCRSQGNYLVHTVTPSVEKDLNSTTYILTESPVKFTRKTSTERTSTSTVRPVYRPASTPLLEEQNEVTQRANTSSENSNLYNLVDGPASSTEDSRKPVQIATTSSEDPNKFAIPYTERNQAFSETLYREK